MIEEKYEEKIPGEAKFIASFFREEVASVDVPPLPSVERSSRRSAPAFLPDLLFTASVLLLLTIALANPTYSIQSSLAKAGIGFAREKQIGFYLEKGLTAFHEAADPIFRSPIFRSPIFRNPVFPRKGEEK